MKKILIAIILGLVLLTSGLLMPRYGNNAGSEIKELIKDVPIPIRYNGSTGEQIYADYSGIRVSKISSSWNYDQITGNNLTLYYATLRYGGFWSFDNTSYTADLICDGDWRFTLQELKDNIGKLYWE